MRMLTHARRAPADVGQRVLKTTDHESKGLQQHDTTASQGSARTPEFKDKRTGRGRGEGSEAAAALPGHGEDSSSRLSAAAARNGKQHNGTDR